MSVDPRTPVIVGVAQVTRRGDEAAPSDPLSLMTEALEGAEADAGAPVLDDLDELVAVSSFVWHPRDPALLVAERLGRRSPRTRLTPTGGNMPQHLVHESARRILAGEVEAVAVTGSEAMHSESRLRRAGTRPDWPHQGDEVPAAELVDEDRVPVTAEEYRQGLTLPVEVYPLFENARRARRGWSIDEHRARLGDLWARFAAVAADNPYAWIRSAPSAQEIVTPSATNRMVGFPYTKMLVANMPVDQGAAFVMTSLERARRLGVDESRLVYPLSGAEANDHWFVSERPELDLSPAMSAIWSALESMGAELADLDTIDLYSCFPTVVQTASDVLGLDPFHGDPAPTVTGGLTFFGGPGNNYVTHSIAETVTRLRGRDATGLVTALGWFSTKHAWGLFGTRPPEGGFAVRDVNDVVAASPRRECVVADGEAVVETYTVSHGRDRPARVIVAATRADGARIWTHSLDPELAARAETEELCGARVQIVDGKVASLSDR